MLHEVLPKNNTTGATSRTGTAYNFGASMFTPDFIEVRMAQSLGFRVFDLLLMLFCELFALSVILQFAFYFYNVFLMGYRGRFQLTL